MGGQKETRPAATEMSLEAVWVRRQYYWGHGFRPFAVWNPGARNMNGELVPNAGKRAKGENWRKGAENDPPAAVQRRPDSVALNTGFLTGELVAVDVDVLPPSLVDQIAAVIEKTVGLTPLIRQGQPPKLAFLYRAETPYARCATAKLQFAEGEKPTMVEVMAKGQSIMADGIHPGTMEPYRWLDQHPLDVPLKELPVLSESRAQAIVEEAERILREAGAVDWVATPAGIVANASLGPDRSERRSRRVGREGEGFFHRVNEQALKGTEDWIRQIWPGAKRAPNGAWRIAAALRGLPNSKQDISIDPEHGIKDFHEDKSLTAIDLVLAYGTQTTPLEAALWLCQCLHVTPERLGYHDRLPPEPPPPAPPEGALPPEPPPPPSPPDGPRRERTIWVVGGLRHVVSEEGLTALREARIEFYVRDRQIVRIVPVKMKNAANATLILPGISEVPLAILGRALGQSAKWMKTDAKGHPIRIDPPVPVVEQISGMVRHWPFPPLSGLVSTPTLRSDGSLLREPGYDERTGLFLTLASDLKLPHIAERPARAQADAALGVLLELLSGFPFISRASRAVALSMLITPVVRPAMPVAPLHLVTAPLPGTGKSYLIDLAAAIATGEQAAVQAMAPREEETEKRLVGAALSGHPVIVLDNVRRVLEGDFLCQISERPLLQLRPLGTSDEVRVRNTFSMFVDGNNLTVADDMVRRCIKCGLDANMQDPETREFGFDPLARIMEDRGRYVAACLTIVLAYHAAGSPLRLKKLLSYGGWSDLVRSALVWLGEDDPLDTMEELRAEDPGRQQRAEIFGAWSELPELDLDGLTTPALIAAAEHSQELREALLYVAEGTGQHGGRIEPKRLGNWLKSQVNAIAAGYKLEVNRIDKKRPKWLVKRVVKAEAEG